MRVNGLPLTIMLLTLTLSLAGFIYAHWTDSIRIEATVKIAHTFININSEKVLISKDVEKYYSSSVSYEVSPNRHTIIINCTNIGPCWYIWVGLVLQNEGTLPANIKTPAYIYTPSDGWGNCFETKEYFYGPYPKSTGYGTLEVWGRVKIGEQLNSNGTVNFQTPSTTPPFTLDPSEKAVIWIWIRCKPDAPQEAQGNTVILYITIIDDPAI